MKRIKIDDPDAIKETLLALEYNQIVAYPTDTIYGIGTDMENIQGIEKINFLKNRKAPMSIIVHNFEEISQKLIIPSKFRNEMDNIIKNGDTCIVEYKSGAFSETITQDNKIGFRVPNYPFLIKLLSLYKKPITTTSINATGQAPLNNPDEIEEIFGNDIDLILDAGKIKNSSASKIYIFDQKNISQIR
mgnify:FL=1|tara:strand:- start:437 stop:1003 length:567 start_codon:yes stop_codon:yes gene_type:complete